VVHTVPDRGHEEVRVQARRPARDSGAAAVEFALVMPLLFLLIIGIIQYGYGFFQLQAAQSTIREAARSAALGIDTCDDWAAVVRDAAEGNGMAAGAVQSIRLDFDNDIGTDVPPERGDSLTATLTYAPSLDFSLIPYPDTLTRRARTTVEDVGALQSPLCTANPTWN
jgi:hypothetical protein